eukprot:2382736-Amphidinium_carterae.1
MAPLLVQIAEFILERFGPVNVQSILTFDVRVAAAGLNTDHWNGIPVRFFTGTMGVTYNKFANLSKNELSVESLGIRVLLGS